MNFILYYIKCKFSIIANQPKHHLIVTGITVMKQSCMSQCKAHFKCILSNHLKYYYMVVPLKLSSSNNVTLPP